MTRVTKLPKETRVELRNDGCFWLLAVGFGLWAVGFWLLAVGFWLLAIGGFRLGYIEREQVYKLTRFVAIGITACERKIVCIFNK